tara:strand:+ start:340 stop:867 length:528 start_codon:yes stop_codon:yes gene_type:complete
MKKFIRELNHLRWIEKELQKITSFPTVGNRIRFSKMFNSKGNVARLNCIHLGMKRMYGGKLSITNRSKDGRFRNLEYLIYDYLKIYYPSLPYNQVLINKNNWFDIHKDKNNKQDIALLLGLGNYTGGELNTHYEDKTLEQTHNIRYRPILFKNKTTYHSVNKWIGNRYSIITYLI